jgi:hypothetical protein
MTRNQSLFFRFMLFVMGAGIVALAFHLFAGGRELTQTDKFMWISIAGMYVVLFAPLFFSSVHIGNFSFKIPSLTLVWMGVCLYLPASAAVIILLRAALISFNAALVIQAVLVFLLAGTVYLGYFANARVREVAAEEAGLRQYLTEIKNRASALTPAVNALPAGYGKIQETLRRALGDIKYITPVQNNMGTETELKILKRITSCTSRMTRGRPSSFIRRRHPAAALCPCCLQADAYTAPI